MIAYDISEAKNGIYFAGSSRGMGEARGWSWNDGGIVPEDTLTTQEALTTLGLDFTVAKTPVRFDPKGEALLAQDLSNLPRTNVTYRTDTGVGLGVVKNTYKIVQNSEAFDLVDTLIDDGSAKWIAGAARDHGRQITMLATINREILIGGDEDERMLPLLVFSTSHDRSCSLTVQIAVFRLVCLNGMTVPTGEPRMIRIRHTANSGMKIVEARRILGISVGYLDTFTKMANDMITATVTDKQFARFLDRFIPVPEVEEGSQTNVIARFNALAMRDAITDSYRKSPNVQNVVGTKWGVYCAVTEALDWSGTIRDKGDAGLTQFTRAATDTKRKDEAFKIIAAL